MPGGRKRSRRRVGDEIYAASSGRGRSSARLSSLLNVGIEEQAKCYWDILLDGGGQEEEKVLRHRKEAPTLGLVLLPCFHSWACLTKARVTRRRLFARVETLLLLKKLWEHARRWRELVKRRRHSRTVIRKSHLTVRYALLLQGMGRWRRQTEHAAALRVSASSCKSYADQQRLAHLQHAVYAWSAHLQRQVRAAAATALVNEHKRKRAIRSALASFASHRDHTRQLHLHRAFACLLRKRKLGWTFETLKLRIRCRRAAASLARLHEVMQVSAAFGQWRQGVLCAHLLEIHFLALRSAVSRIRGQRAAGSSLVRAMHRAMTVSAKRKALLSLCSAAAAVNARRAAAARLSRAMVAAVQRRALRAVRRASLEMRAQKAAASSLCYVLTSALTHRSLRRWVAETKWQREAQGRAHGALVRMKVHVTDVAIRRWVQKVFRSRVLALIDRRRRAGNCVRSLGRWKWRCLRGALLRRCEADAARRLLHLRLSLHLERWRERRASSTKWPEIALAEMGELALLRAAGLRRWQLWRSSRARRRSLCFRAETLSRAILLHQFVRGIERRRQASSRGSLLSLAAAERWRAHAARTMLEALFRAVAQARRESFYLRRARLFVRFRALPRSLGTWSRSGFVRGWQHGAVELAATHKRKVDVLRGIRSFTSARRASILARATFVKMDGLLMRRAWAKWRGSTSLHRRLIAFAARCRLHAFGRVFSSWHSLSAARRGWRDSLQLAKWGPSRDARLPVCFHRWRRQARSLRRLEDFRSRRLLRLKSAHLGAWQLLLCSPVLGRWRKLLVAERERRRKRAALRTVWRMKEPHPARARLLTWRCSAPDALLLRSFLSWQKKAELDSLDRVLCVRALRQWYVRRARRGLHLWIESSARREDWQRYSRAALSLAGHWYLMCAFSRWCGGLLALRRRAIAALPSRAHALERAWTAWAGAARAGRELRQRARDFHSNRELVMRAYLQWHTVACRARLSRLALFVNG